MRGLAAGFLFIVSSAVAEDCAYRLRMILARDSLQNEMLRLNEILIARVSKQLNAMPEVQRNSLLRVLDTRGKFLPHGEMGNVGTSDLFEAPTRVKMNLDPFIADHPLSRVVLAHEFDHATRATSRWVDQSSAWYAAKIEYTFNGVINEERRAFGAEYDFLRAAYGEADYRRLRVAAAPLEPDEMQKLVDAKIFSEEGNLVPDRYMEMSKEGRAEYKPYVDRILNSVLYGHVRRSRDSSKEVYVNRELENAQYHDFQKQMHLKALKKYAMLVGTGAVFEVSLKQLIDWVTDDYVRRVTAEVEAFNSAPSK